LMAEVPGVDKMSAGRLRPRAVLDGGGEEWPALATAVARLIDELAAGAVLEVISREPGIRDHLLAWCDGAGHELTWSLEDGQATRFWITKGNRQ
jgi:TusA-related sulfurtransferase